MARWIKSLRGALSQIDLYREEITLLYKNEKAYSHPTGQFFSIALITLTVFSFISLTVEMYALNSPNVVTSLESNLNPAKKFEINPDNFFFAFGIADYNGIPLINTDKEVWWTTEFEFCRQRTVIKKNGMPEVVSECTFIPMVSCAETQIDPKFYEGLSIERLALFSCPNSTIWNKVKNETYIHGLPSSDDYSFISFRYFLCNSSAQSNCATDQAIAERLPFGFVQSIFTDRLLDQKKSDDPYNIVIKTTTSVITTQQQAYVKNTLRHSQSDSITNFFYYVPTQTIYRTVTLSTQVEQLLQTADSLYQMIFLLDDRKEVYTRTYSTFFDILGNIGGLQSFISIVLSFIVGPLTKRSQRLALINQVFQFETNDDQNAQQLDLDMTPNLTPMNKSGLTVQVGDSTTREVKLKKLMTQKEKKLGLKWWQQILTPAEKRIQFEQGVKIFEQQLDVTNIINKLFELEKLKKLILDEDQYRLFEYLPKPVITPKVDKLGSISPQRMFQPSDWLMENENFETKFVKATNSYKKLKNLIDMKNQKLLQMLDPQIRENFEVYGEQDQGQARESKSALWEQID